MNRTFRQRASALLLAFCLLWGFCPTLPAFAATEVIEISSAADLTALSKATFAEISEAEIVLTKDIDMSGRAAIAPIGGGLPFNGTFDGQGYVIRNLKITGTGTATGLFGQVGEEGTVCDLGLENLSVVGDVNTGAIAGALLGKVSRCAVSGSVIGWRYTGGIAGLLYGGTIEDCWLDVAMDGSRYCGGLFGGTRFDTEYLVENAGKCLFTEAPETAGETTVRNNLVLGSMYAHVRSAGLAGTVDSTDSRPLKAFEGNVSHIDSLELERFEAGSNFYGPLYANWSETVTTADGAPNNLYWEGISFLYNDAAAAASDTLDSWLANQASATKEELASMETYEDLGWDFSHTWEWDDDLEHPVLQGMTFYQVNEVRTVYIDGLEDFLDFCDPDNFTELSNDNIILTADIDMENQDAIAPVGGGAAFTGTFDGGGHVIRKLTIKGTEGTDVCTGLFGYVGDGGQVFDLGLLDVTVNGHVNTGSVAGALTGSISRCYATGSVNGKRYTGGLVGLLHAGALEDCWTDMTVTGSRYCGGLFGGTDYDTKYGKAYTPISACITHRDMTVRNCLALGTVQANRYVGGLVGEVDNTNSSPLGAFEGNVAWLTAVTALASGDGGPYYGPVYAWWNPEDDTTEDAFDNLYYEGMSVTGQDACAVSDTRNVTATAEELGAQDTYEAIGWDFDSVWVWSDQLGHPVLQGFAVYRPGAQLTPASLVTTFVESPKTSRAFTWFTDDTVEGSVVQAVPASRYDDESDFLGRWAEEAEGSVYALEVLSGVYRNIHKVNLTGLKPGTTYYYRAGDGESNWSPVYTFTTERASADSFTFFHITDTQDQYENYRTALEHATENYPEGEFILHGGDVIQNNITTDYDEVYRLTADYVSNLASMVTPGNHELNKDSQDTTTGTEEPDFVKGIDNYKAHYQFPNNGPEGYEQTVYSFTYGCAYFAVLNSNLDLFEDKNFDDQIAWLKADVAANGADKAWQVVSVHHGPISNSKTISSVNQDLIYALQEAGVDLVLFGHYHLFLRSDPLLLNEDGTVTASEDGIIYYSAGCSGGIAGDAGSNNYFTVRTNDSDLPIYAAITLSEDSLSVTSNAVPLNPSQRDQVLDTVERTKPDAAVATAPAAVEGLVYDGSEQTLITAGSAQAGTMLYSLDGETYSEELPTAADAGTYTVYYKAGGLHHTDTQPLTLEVTVAPKDISGAQVVLGRQLTYNGRVQTQQVERVTVDGLEVTFDTEGDTGREAGLYELTVIGNGNFTGSVTKVWRIAKRAASITPANPEKEAEPEQPQVEDDHIPLSRCPQDESCPIHPFTDAVPTEWYHDGVHTCLERGLMKGTGNGTFSPSSNVTREQVWMMLARLSGAQPATMAEARSWAMGSGVSDGTNPLANITREQLATMLFRYARLMGYDVSVGEDTNILSYRDVFTVSEYAVSAMQWSCGAGVVGGFPDGTLRPLATASRAEAAAMFQRFCESTVR